MEITKGICTKTSRHGGSFYIETEKETICKMERGFHSEANAQLITEAFSVANETGFSPRQLAERNKKLLEALKEMLSIIGDSAGNSQFDMFKEVIDAKKLIKQAN